MTRPPTSPPPDRPDPALGRVVRQLREERGIDRADLAEQAGVEERTLAGIEAGTLDPAWATVEALAAGLGVSMKSIANAVVAEDPEAP